MQLGLCRARQNILRDDERHLIRALKWKFFSVYLHNIIIFSQTADAHIELVHSLILLLQNAEVSLKLKKRRLFSGNIDYLGHVVHPSRLQLANHTTDATQNLKTTSSSCETAVVSRFMKCKPTVRFQLCRTICNA